MSKRFDRNVEKWAEMAPRESALLSFYEDETCKFAKTELGELNLQIGDFLLHSPKGAMQEALQWADQIEFKKCELCFVYGVGLGYAYTALRPWLKKNKNRMVVFLEDNLSVIKSFMETETASKMLRDLQVRLHFISGISLEDPFFKSLYWSYALRPVVIACLPSYQEMKKEKFENLSHGISFTNAYHNAMVDEYVNFGGPFFFNFYRNLLNLQLSYEGNKFFGKFKNVPAIICGAGPSLDKQMDQLQTLSKKALLFGCGSGMNALNAAGIKPHFGAAVDPNPTQSIRLKTNSAGGIPYFYRNRVNSEALNLISGPRLYVSGCGGYDLPDFFEDQLKIKRTELDEGYNVVNLAIDIAKQLGCNPIIVTGCDLAYTDLKSYAQGVEGDASVTVSQIVTNEDYDQQAILKTDMKGRPVYTLWKWIAEAEWISDFAKKNKDVTILNASEGGIGFPDVVNVTLQECIDNYLSHDFDLHERIYELVKKTSLARISKKKIISLMLEISKSFERCEEFLTTLAEEGIEVIRKTKELESIPTSIQSGAFALAEVELTEEPAYIYLLANFNAVFSLLLGREFEAVHNRMPRTPDWKKLIKKIQISNKKFYFLRNTCRANRAIIDWALRQEQEQEQNKTTELTEDGETSSGPSNRKTQRFERNAKI